MELLEFFEKHIPEFDTRFQTWKAEVEEEWGCCELPLLYYDFFKGAFPEALQNYTDKICEKQREICADAYRKYCGIIESIMIREEILYAEQPNTKELWN